MLNDLLKMDLQYFADPDPKDNPGDDPGADKGQDDPKDPQDPSKTKDKTFTQDDINNAVKDRLERERKKFEKELEAEREKARTDAERYAQMTETEKENAKVEDRIKALEAREKELNNRELLANIKTDLSERELPIAFADSLLKIQDNEQIKGAIDEIKEVWDAEIAEAKKAGVRQETPKGSTKSYTDDTNENKTRSDLFKKGRKI